jgi:dihydroorotase
MFVGMAGVMIADYFILRRQHVELAHLFARPGQGKYSFVAGVNWPAIGAMLISGALYMLLFDPVTLKVQPLFRFLGAGIPAIAEEVMVQRDITLAGQADIRYHVAHVSTQGSVALVRQAKAAGKRVTTEVCPHHLLLTDEACQTFDPNFKMNPPLRGQADVAACLEGVRDGTIDCLISDHAPHGPQDKEDEFQSVPFGIIGLETALGLFIKALIDPKILDWPKLIHALSTRPAQLLNIAGGSLKVGAPADVTVIDPQREWTVDVETMRSKARNSPFHGWKLRGKALATVVGGELRYRETR